MDKERLEAIRSSLEQGDPCRGEYTRARTEHDQAIKWELLLEVERLRGVLADVTAAWDRSWDCSRSPGHEAMHTAVNAAAEALDGT